MRLIEVAIRSLSSLATKCTGEHLRHVLVNRFPKATVSVVDMSGGCGDMFEVTIESAEFKGLSILKQHQLITGILKDQITNMHGVRIYTSVPKD